jgi:antitoxin (DNA-binding transcriptional repressor) of toxin-antitoxin stability system
MKQVSLSQAKADLSNLVEQAAAGEEIIAGHKTEAPPRTC